MKKSLILVLLFCSSLYAQDQGIHFFTGTFEEAKTEAKKQNKYLFIDCSENGCAPCYEMDKNIFPLKNVSDFYNANFICLKRNMFVGEGVDIRAKYVVTGFPTYLYLDADGEVAHFVEGSCKAEQFIERGKTALSDTNNMKGMINRFQRGERDSSFLRKLIYTTKNGNPVICEKALALYWEMIPDTALFQKDNFNLFYYNEADINSRVYKYIYAHQVEFLTKFFAHKDYSQYDYHARNVLENDSDFLYLKAATAVKTAGETNDSILLRQAKAIAFQSKYDDSRYIACMNEIQYDDQTQYWQEVLSDIDGYFNKFEVKHFVYNNFADALVKKTDDKAVLDKALQYNEKCISFGKNYNNMETHAHILFKLGRIEEAIVAANESIKLAAELNNSHIEADELLDEIKQNLSEKN